MKLRGFPSGVVFGLLIWVASDSLFGRDEPWESDVAWGYLLLLSIGGYVHVELYKSGIAAAFCSIYLGQLIYILLHMLTADGDTFTFGAPVLLLAWNLPVLAGAIGATWMLARATKGKDRQ